MVIEDREVVNCSQAGLAHQLQVNNMSWIERSIDEASALNSNEGQQNHGVTALRVCPRVCTKPWVHEKGAAE